MSPDLKAKLRVMANHWLKESNRLARKSAKTWRALRGSVLPQEDEIIYSVYEDSAAAITLEDCARKILVLINSHTGK